MIRGCDNIIFKWTDGEVVNASVMEWVHVTKMNVI